MKCHVSLVKKEYRFNEDIQPYKKIGFKFKKGKTDWNMPVFFVQNDEIEIELNTLDDLCNLIKQVDSEIIVGVYDNILSLQIYNGYVE